MFDIGWSELLVIGVVALIVVGPKDLPQMFRALGRFTAKAKSMAREFTRAMEDAADEAGVKDVAKDLKSATSARSLGLDKVEEAVTKFEQWNPMDDKDDGDDARPAKGPATEALSKERAEVAEKIRDAGAKAALKRKAAETGASDAAAKKPAAKKPAAKKPAAKKPAARKPAAKKTTASKPAAKKPAAGAGGKGV